MSRASLFKSPARLVPGVLRPHVVSNARWAASTAMSTSLDVASDILVMTEPVALIANDQ